MIKLPKLYSQLDSRWKGELLGFNTSPQYSIGSYGCLITVLAMVADYYGRQETPDSINTHLKQMVNGFSAGTGYYYWGALPRLFTDIGEKIVWTPDLMTDAQIAEIKKGIDTGYPVMCQIDFQPATEAPDMHFVLLLGYNPNDENDFTIADPWTGAVRSLKDYLSGTKPSARKTIEMYVTYTGKVPQATTLLSSQVIDWPDAETAYQTVGWYVREWNVEKKQRLALQGQVSDLTAKVNAISSKLVGVKTSLDTITSQLVFISSKLS